MTNDRMVKDARSSNARMTKCRSSALASSFVSEALSFLRPSSFVLRHSPLLLALVALLLLPSPLPAQTPGAQAPQEITPPFGLSWGETDDRLEKMLKGAKANIIERKTIEDGRAVWTVEGIVHEGLRRTLFYFRRGELVEAELQYQKDEWDQAKYDEIMGKIRRKLETNYGAGQQLVRKTEPEGDVMQTIVGYKWNRNGAAVELVYYSAQQSPNIFRTLSVHYKVH